MGRALPRSRAHALLFSTYTTITNHTLQNDPSQQPGAALLAANAPSARGTRADTCLPADTDSKPPQSQRNTFTCYAARGRWLIYPHPTILPDTELTVQSSWCSLALAAVPCSTTFLAHDCGTTQSLPTGSIHGVANTCATHLP